MFLLLAPLRFVFRLLAWVLLAALAWHLLSAYARLHPGGATDHLLGLARSTASSARALAPEFSASSGDPLAGPHVGGPGYPDPILTPGALNPSVTQATISSTICVRGWTRTVRPPLEYTAAVKRSQFRRLGLPGHPSGYEEDHFIPLELGGAPEDERNLWPQPRAGVWSAARKDQLENALRRDVCAGRSSLAAAQHAIASDWHAAWSRELGG